MIDLRPSTSVLDFGTDPDFCTLFSIEYTLNRITQNVVCEIFRSDRPSDNELRWRWFGLYECFLVLAVIS